MPLTRSRERHTCGAQQYCTVSDVNANSNIYVLQFQPIKTIRGLQYQPIKTRVKETEKLDSYRRTTLWKRARRKKKKSSNENTTSNATSYSSKLS